MRIAVVDDEQCVRETLQNYIARFALENGGHYEVDLYSCADALLERYHQEYDILIFDIDMPGTDGLEAARRIRIEDASTVLLFVTNIAQYAIKGYEVEAFDYIVKPIDYYDFLLKFRRTVRKAEMQNKKTIVLEIPGGYRKVPTSYIIYIRAEDHYLYYHLADGEIYKVRGYAKEHADMLLPYHFCQIHKSYIVNLAHIDRVQANKVSIKEKLLPISRVYKGALMNQFSEYMLG